MVGIDVPMPNPVSASAIDSGAKGGAEPAGDAATSAASAARPLAESAKPAEGAAAPSRRATAGLAIEPVRKPTDNGRIATPASSAVRPSPVCK